MNIVKDGLFLRHYYSLRADNETVNSYGYIWSEEIEKYVPDGNSHFNLKEEGWESWDKFANHMRKRGYLSVEEQLEKGTCRKAPRG